MVKRENPKIKNGWFSGTLVYGNPESCQYTFTFFYVYVLCMLMLEYVDSHKQLATLSKTVVRCRGCDQDGHRFSEWTDPNFDPYPMTETPWCFSTGGLICFIIPTLGSCKFQYSLTPGQVLGLFDMLTPYLNKYIYIYIYLYLYLYLYLYIYIYYIYIYMMQIHNPKNVFFAKKKQHLCHGQNLGYVPIQGDGHQSIIRLISVPRHWGNPQFKTMVGHPFASYFDVFHSRVWMWNRTCMDPYLGLQFQELIPSGKLT